MNEFEDMRTVQERYRELVRLKDPIVMEKRRRAENCIKIQKKQWEQTEEQKAREERWKEFWSGSR